MKSDSQKTAELLDQLDELTRNLEVVMKENEVLTKVLTADAGLAGAVAEIKKLNKEIDALRERNAGLMEEKNAAVRVAKAARSSKKAVAP